MNTLICVRWSFINIWQIACWTTTSTLSHLRWVLLSHVNEWVSKKKKKVFHSVLFIHFFNCKHYWRLKTEASTEIKLLAPTFKYSALFLNPLNVLVKWFPVMFKEHTTAESATFQKFLDKWKEQADEKLTLSLQSHSLIRQTRPLSARKILWDLPL